MKNLKLIIVASIFIIIWMNTSCETFMTPEREFIVNPGNSSNENQNMGYSSGDNCIIEVKQSTINSIVTLMGVSKILEMGGKLGDPNTPGYASSAMKYHIYLNDRYMGENYALIRGIPAGWYDIKIVNGLTNNVVFQKNYYINPGEKINVFY